MSKPAKLRGHSPRRLGPYPLGQLPASLAIAIGKQIVHRLAVGNANITGDDFGTIFAKAIDGEHRQKPLGVADVTWQSCAWSVKTVQDNNPHEATRIRAISGRNDIDYSFGIKDPFSNVQEAGNAVLEIWNVRIDESLNQYDDLRIFVMVRNMGTLDFTLMEYEALRFVPANYKWLVNVKENFEGFDAQTNEHCFTWQPGGSQFTVIHHIPNSAYRFKINRHPPMIPEHQILHTIGFDETWISHVMTPQIDAGKAVKK